MVLNQCSTTTTSNAAVCSNCAAAERWLLHSVRREGVLLRLCTTCVLRLHPHAFCPTCFTVYPPSPSTFITCNNCYSISHSSCVEINPKSSYICPMCQSPNAPIFLVDKVKDFDGVGASGGGGGGNRFVRVDDEKGMCRNGNGVRGLDKGGDFDVIGGSGGVENGVVGINHEKGMFVGRKDVRISDRVQELNGVVGMNDGNEIVISRNDMRILEAAATISCFSMSEAALDKKCEAEKRAQEAVYTRKRAKQALEHMAIVVAKEKMRGGQGSGVEVDVSRLGGNVGGVMERRDGYGNNSIANGGGGGVSGGIRSLERSEMKPNGGLVTEMNAVEFREKEGSGGIKSQGNGATVDVNEHTDVSLGSSLDVGGLSVQTRDGGIVCEISSDPDHQLNQSGGTITVINNDVVLPPPKEDQLQVVENGHQELNNNDVTH